MLGAKAIVSVSAAKGAPTVAVLVVEDDFLVRYDIAGCLRDAGYVVIETESGEEAIALCQSRTPIDVVFTDINLGGPANGWDVAECFRTVQPGVPVLYTSGQGVNAERCVCGSEFVAKPYQHAHILDACRRLRGR